MRGNLGRYALGGLALAKPRECMFCDVEASYDGGYRFAFTLVFARGVSGMLDEGDLVSPPGRFANMRLFVAGAEWQQSSQPIVTRLAINLLEPTRLTFSTYIGFAPAVHDARPCVLGLHNNRIEVTGIEGDGDRSLRTSSTLVHSSVSLTAGFRKPADVVRFTGFGGSRSLRKRYN